MKICQKSVKEQKNTAQTASSIRHLKENMPTDGRLAPIVIPDGDLGLDPTNYLYPQEYKGHLESVMIDRQQIMDRVKVLAKQIHEDYDQERLVMICVLKGASPFYQHLLDALQELQQAYSMEFIRAKSYKGTSSTGTIKVSGGLDYASLKDRHVLIVEDIVDTGTTLSQLLPLLQEKGSPKSLQVVALLEKRLSQPLKAHSKYTGFSIPDHFIIGYGIDYNEFGRDLKDIWVISQAGIAYGDSTTE